MINNKQALELFEIGSFSETFVKYLKKRGLDNDAINYYLEKAKQIHEKLSVKRKDIGMLVGKVQSGKTTVFSGVISRYFDKGYDVCVILTSIENLLNNQTNERMKEVFCSHNPSKVSVYNYDAFMIRNTTRRIEKIRDDLKNGNKYIITILKNKQIEKINEVFLENKIWKNKKILIVDDEADLASTGSNDIDDVRYANNAIKNMLESLSNYNYLSVTATPQAQVLINDDDAVKPKHVFTYEPGNGYMGINEFFNDDSFFKFINADDWKDDNDITQLPESLKEAVMRYIINISHFIIKNEKIEPTTMLIHTSIAIEDHYKIMRLLIKFKDNLYLYLNQDKSSLDYIETANKFKSIFDNSYANILTWDDEYINLIKKIISYTNINIINSESDDSIIENTNNIVLGSKKVERGVTLDNLLLTYITNFHEGTTAVDTILQRARWFGYRNHIKDSLTIYIVPSLYKQYKEYIMPSENELWERLKDAEINDNFTKFEKYISLSGKSAPTNKVRTLRSAHDKILFYDSRVERDIEVERNSKSIYLHFNQKPKNNINIISRPYTGILDLSFLDFCEQIKENKIYETIGIDYYFWQELKKKAEAYKFVILFFDNAGKNNYRERTPENGKYQLFEGSSDDTGFPGEQALYKINGLNDKVIICLHKIRDKLDNKLKYYVSLHLPKDNIFSGKYYVENKKD